MEEFMSGLQNVLSVASPLKGAQSPSPSKAGQVGVGLRLNSKLEVLEIVPGGAAATCTVIAIGDTLTHVDGATVTGNKPQDITHLMLGDPGSVAALGLKKRDGTVVTARVVRGARPSVGVGMKLQRNEANEISVLEVARGGMAEELRVSPGDVLEEINGQNVLGWTVSDATPLLRSTTPDESSTLLISFLRGAQRDRILVEFPQGGSPGTTPEKTRTAAAIYSMPQPGAKAIQSPARGGAQHPASASVTRGGFEAPDAVRTEEAQRVLEEAHLRLREAQAAVQDAERVRFASGEGTLGSQQPQVRVGGAEAGTIGIGQVDVSVRMRLEADATIEAAIKQRAAQAEAKRREAWEEEEREVAEEVRLLQIAAEAEAKLRLAWEEEEREVAEEVETLLRAKAAEEKRRAAWEEEESEVAAEIEAFKVKRIEEEKRRLSYETQEQALAQELALASLLKSADGRSHAAHEGDGEIGERARAAEDKRAAAWEEEEREVAEEVETLLRAKAAEEKRRAAWEEEESEVAAEIDEAARSQPSLEGFLDEESIVTLRSLRSAEEKRQAAWDEEEAEVAAEIALRVAALAAEDKRKAAWEEEEMIVAEEIRTKQSEFASRELSHADAQASLLETRGGGKWKSSSSPPIAPRRDPGAALVQDMMAVGGFGGRDFESVKSEGLMECGFRSDVQEGYVPQGDSFPPPSFSKAFLPSMTGSGSGGAVIHEGEIYVSEGEIYVPSSDSFPPPQHSFEGDYDEDEWGEGAGSLLSLPPASEVERESVRSLRRGMEAASEAMMQAEMQRLREAEDEIRRAAAELDARRADRMSQREEADGKEQQPSMAFDL